MCFQQIEYAGILKGAEQEKLAKVFLDYMLSEDFQNEIPLNMFVYPVNQLAEIPQEFTDFAQVPTKPAILDSDLIAENRENWIASWRELFTN